MATDFARGGDPSKEGGENGSERTDPAPRMLAALVAVGNVLDSGAALPVVLDRAVREVARALEVEYAKILELLPGGKEVRLVAGVGWKPGLVGEACVSTGLDSQAGYTLASEHPIVVDDLRADTRFSGPWLLHDHGVISGLSCVIAGEGGRPYGVFGAHTRAQRRFGKSDALFLQAMSSIVSAAIVRARSDETVRDTRRVLEREVEARTQELRVAAEDLEAFNAMVAHDLRGPLRGFEEIARAVDEDYAERLDEEGARLLKDLTENATRMRDLVDDLLVLAKAGRDPLQMEDVDVSALARERWRRLEERDGGRAIQFEVADGLTARADPALLGAALDNLLHNARKFTRHAPRPRVEIGSIHLEAGGTAFFVRDNGVGFAPESASRLFHPFRRLHASTEFEGSGVGLATVRRIAERHGGSVWAASEGPGEGATIYFRLLPAGLP